MIENDIDALIDEELKCFTHAHPIDVKCFIEHRIKPRAIQLCMDLEGKEWRECYLITDHNNVEDSPYRAAFDPKYDQFVREITLENGIPHYLGSYPNLESLVDEFA
ncbi:TPA: hypothetical protein I7136_23390 [Vibrio vulnificus]|nr:hypothetical protein [Vibrio vulnificus]HAS6022006.1 hypothetical protein [Vibrio vulnificus]